MKISYEWLRKYINIKVRPEVLAERLTMAGHEVSLIEKKQGDFILDIEVTPNRPDCLSHIGIAREVSAVTGKRLNLEHVSELKKHAHAREFKIVRENKICCPLYTLRVLNNAKVAHSPKWLLRRLSSIGLNPINNIVDAVNFVLFETGHPLHAFDLDKIKGNEIFIRNAKPDELIVTIDDIERKLQPHMLVIADAAGPIAIAGVMGGRYSAITDKTKNVLLESAYFDPVSIRRTSFALGLSTDSSYRFERGADWHNTAASSHRGASLICDIAKAQAGGFIVSAEKAKPPTCINLRVSYLNKILGTAIKSANIRQILAQLGCKVKGASTLDVTVPSYRSDITREADLIEEIARIYGYDNIDSAPASIVATGHDDAVKDFMAKRSIAKSALVSSGFSEAVCYSLIGKNLLKGMLWTEDDCVKIKNPLSKEQEIMRPSLLPGLIKAAAYNISRQVYDIKLFELSNIYFKKDKEYREEPCIALAVYEKAHIVDTKGMTGPGFFLLKGVTTRLAGILGIKALDYEKTTSALFDEGYSLSLLSGNTVLGSMGRLKGELASNFGIPGALFIAEINFSQLVLSAHTQRYYKPLPRFPYTYRDISFVIDTTTEYKQIELLVKNTAGHLVEGMELLSEYRGRQIEQDKKSLAIRVIFRSKEKTLSEEEISAIDHTIRKSLEKTFNAILR